MQKVGITGGIGSGKSTVCRIFKSLGIPIYDADERAKWLMTQDKFLIENIKQLFGEAAYFDDGSLNRMYISSIAFKNSSKLSSLNDLVHPAVGLDGENWFNALQNVPYGIKEAALLVESGSYIQLDKLIVVTAPLEVRIQRVMLRDKAERATVEARIAKQMSEAEKIALADFVVVNDGERMLIPQVIEIHKILIAK